MWSDRPNAFKDGVLVATALSLALLAIVITKGSNGGNALLVPQCQEVVVDVEKRGNILARCPVGTYIEIDDYGNVICRCGDRQAPTYDKEPHLFNDPMPTQPTLPAPFPQRNDTGIVL